MALVFAWKERVFSILFTVLFCIDIIFSLRFFIVLLCNILSLVYGSNGNELSFIAHDPPFENIADAHFKINGSRDNLRRDCWRWEINFITFALRSRHYPRLHHQPIIARRAVYIIIAEVAISRSLLRRSIMVNPAAARNNKGSSDIMVMVCW